MSLELVLVLGAPTAVFARLELAVVSPVTGRAVRGDDDGDGNPTVTDGDNGDDVVDVDGSGAEAEE